MPLEVHSPYEPRGDQPRAIEGLTEGLQDGLRFQTLLMQAQNQMTQINDISRQRYETRIGELSGMAASAGFDWSPGSY